MLLKLKLIIMLNSSSVSISTSNIQFSLSEAFDEISNYCVTIHESIDKEHLSEFMVIQNNEQNTFSKLYFRIIKSLAGKQVFIQSANLYAHYLKDVNKYAKELRLVPPLLKYAIYRDKDEIEILSNFCGIPIKCLWSAIQKVGSKEKINGIDKINIMATIYSECMSRLSNLVCGTLSMETILFDEINCKVRVQDAYALRHMDEVTDSQPFKVEKPGIYYSLTYNNLIPQPLNSYQAITADIKALAICILELGIQGKYSIKEFFVDGKIRVDDLIQYNDIFENTKTLSKSVQLKAVLLRILKATDNLMYNMEDLKITILEKNEEFTTITREDDLNNFTLNKNPYKKDGMKLKRFSKLNIEVYLVTFENGIQDSFIVKKYKNTNEYDKELQILTNIGKFNKISPINILAKKKQNVETGPNELAIEYGGISLAAKFRNTLNKDDTLLKAMFNFMIELCEELIKLKMYHGDIKPENISINAMNMFKVFDYDISTIEPKPVVLSKSKFDEDVYWLAVNGFTIEYSSPEVIKALLENKTLMMTNPFKSDVYSIAKSILAAITNCFSYQSMIPKIYGHELDKIEEIVKKHLLYNSIPHEKIKSKKSLGIYYYMCNDILVERVKSLKLDDINCDETLYRSIMNMLSKMLSTNPNDRPDFQTLKNMYIDIANLGSWKTFKYTNKFETQIKRDAFEIVTFDSQKPNNIPNCLTGFQYISTTHNEQTNQESDQETIEVQPQIIQIKRSKILYEYAKEISAYKFNSKTVLYPPNYLNKYATQVHCVIENNLEPTCFFIGGSGNIDPIKSVLALENNKLVPKADMNFARVDFGVVSWNNFIAVAGGCADLEYIQYDAECSLYLNNVEIYSAKENKWNQLAKLKEHKKSVAMAYKNNKLYIIGGILENVDSILNDTIENTVVYGRLIEVIDIDNAANHFIFSISSKVTNGIWSCVAIIKDDGQIMVLRDLVIDSAPLSLSSPQGIYSIKMNEATKDATIMCETGGMLAPYYGYETTDCFMTLNGYIILPKYTQRSEITEAKVIEYEPQTNKFETFTFEINNQ